MESEDFCWEGNLFADLKSHSLKANIAPRQETISEIGGRQKVNDSGRTLDDFVTSSKPLGLSFPNNDDFKSLLVSFSTRLTNKYLVTRVIQCRYELLVGHTTHLYNIAKPFVWHQDEGASVMEGAVR